MREIKDALIAKGWHVSTCLWQKTVAGGGKPKYFILEGYLISRSTTTKMIILQHFIDDNTTGIFSNDTELL